VTQGEALEVTRENGIADLVAFTLTVKARPADIPNELVVDISELRLGDSIRVADIVLPAGVTTDTDPEDSIVVTSVTRAEAEAATDGEEGAEAEAVEGAAGSGESGEEAAEG
jgi:large subunit ribosomal protein L25